MILVTGGSGFVGRAVVRRLKELGHSVRVVVRHPEKIRSLPEFQGVELCAGDLSLPGGFSGELFSGVQAVIHLVGIIWEPRKGAFNAVHVGATRHVLDAAKLAGVKRIIHMSALGTRRHAASRYHQTKWEAEELVRQSGMDWTIVRPSVIYGGGDGFVSTFARIMRFPWNLLHGFVVPCFGKGNMKFQPVSVDAVAWAIARSLTREEAVGKVFDLCGNRKWTLKEMLVAIAEALGLKPAWLETAPEFYPVLVPWVLARGSRPVILTVPFWLGYAMAFVLERLPFPPPITADQIIMLEEGNTGNSGEASEILGFDPSDFGKDLPSFVGV